MNFLKFDFLARIICKLIFAISQILKIKNFVYEFKLLSLF